MDISLRQLEYAVAVATHLNFGSAAKACHVSQPALSSQLSQLEERLGVRLFERDRRGVILTQAGESLLESARRILTEVGDFVDCAKAFANPHSGLLKLGVIPTLAPYIMPKVVPALSKAFPELKLLLREDQTDRLVQQCQDGELDLLILALEADLKDLEEEFLFKDPFVVAMPKQHRLAMRKRMKIDDIENENLLLLEDGHCLRDQVIPLCDSAGACELEGFRATSLGTLVQMVGAGMGITLIPQSSMGVEVHPNSAFVTRPFAKNGPYRSIGMAWRSSSPHKQHYKKLAQVVLEATKAMK